MTDWRVLLFSAIACLMLVAGLLVLALPDSYEGRMLVQLDATHSVRLFDVLGLGLAAAGATIAWLTALRWRRTMQRQEV